MENYKLYINGNFQDSSSKNTFTSIDPSTEEPWASFAEANADDVNAAVESAYNAFRGDWSKLFPTQRGQYLRAIGDQLKENAELLGTIETRDTGKMFKETKFQGIIAATTPMGSLVVKTCMSGLSIGRVVPSILSTRPA